MIYIPYVIFNLVIMVLCYLTNPIVCLFANEVGDLPGFLKYWQTWDDSCDVDFFVKERVPSFLRYDFDSKYISSRETTPELSEVGRDRGCVILREGVTFSVKERIQRYFCRVLWLTRNCGYGFAFYVFGRKVKQENVVITNNLDNGKDEFITLYDSSEDWLSRPWMLKMDVHIVGGFRINAFLGWKIDYTTPGMHMAMIANRIVPRFD